MHIYKIIVISTMHNDFITVTASFTVSKTAQSTYANCLTGNTSYSRKNCTVIYDRTGCLRFSFLMVMRSSFIANGIGKHTLLAFYEVILYFLYTNILNCLYAYQTSFVYSYTNPQISIYTSYEKKSTTDERK